ncbi:ligand-binding sensor domain-containing diguanylate cyclase [Roseateles sp.]|uniref:ligand-binding sensor domain-containing diguanylate cyclase n=1 Tax=Roseateles sp. TaxID=1971397 RepID=UPI0025E5346C|nr:ligand-binding sensor domain-containing diguanylate cyclase [Roseateles sp.]MBV8034193.1 diguanylate cyclase [Roseateles sp.]
MRVLLRKGYATLLIASGLAGPAWAVTPRFEPVGEADSLRDRAVSALAMDAQGFLWVGMPDGLQRFDGYRFRRHPLRDPADSAPVDQFVRSLLADPRGGLWVAAGNSGLAWLDTASGQWTRWARTEGGPIDALAPASNAVRALALEPDGSLWVGTQGGLSRLDPQRRGFTHMRGAGSGLPDDRIAALLRDRHGTLWIGSWQGLARKRAGSDRIEPVALGLARPQITLLAETRDGRVLVGTGLGDLRMLSAEDGRVLPFAERSGASDGAWPVLSMTQAGDDELWLGGRNGIERRRASDGALIERLPHDGSSPAPVPRSEVRALLRDPSGTIWAGSYRSGLMRHVPPLPGLALVQNDDERWRRFGDLDVRSVLQLDDGRVWLGTQAAGVLVLDAALRPVDEIVTVAGRKAPLGRIGALAQTPDGVWLATESELMRFDPDGRWRQTLATGRVTARRMVATRDGQLWIATTDGLWRLPPRGSELLPVMLADGRRSGGEVNAVLEMRDGSLWVGGAAGLLRIARPDAAQPVADAPATPGLVGRTVVGLAVDGRGALWVDTSAGLHRGAVVSDAQGLRFEHFPAASGDDVIGAFGANLLADAQGRVWTHRGFFDPRSGQRQELGAVDGADIGTAWFRAYTRLADGRFLFGGARGVLVLQPERFAPWAYRPPVVATELHLGGVNRPLPAAGQPLVLAPGERSFSLGFAALDFSRPASIHYRYRLEGLDAGWLEAGATARRAAYTNLEPGSYVMRVQGSNRQGDWSPHELRLDVQVRAAWWQTRWLQVLAGLATLGLLLAAFRLRTRMLLQRQHALEARVAEATAALAAKSAELEEASLTDPLTGLRNRRFLEQQLPGDVALAVRRHESSELYGHAPLTAPLERSREMLFFLIDVDHFKRINDEHGHMAGDAVLMQMRGRLIQVFRASDYLVRWGGEEFLVVARETPRTRAAELAERARQCIAGQPFDLGGGVRLSLTCSVGFTAFPLCAELPRALDWRAAVDLADAALYQAKKGGRDAWVGLLDASAAGEAELRGDTRRPLADWAASGRLRLLQSD